MNPQWTCSVCGAEHDGLPLDLGFDHPWYWNQERDEKNGFLNSDLCFIESSPDEADYFVRGLIEIPIVDGTTDDEAYFGLGIWVSLSERNFKWYVANFEADAAAQRALVRLALEQGAGLSRDAQPHDERPPSE